MSHIKILFLVLLLSFSCSKQSGSSPTDSVSSVFAKVQIDMSTTHGTYRDVLGVNKAPRGTDSQGFASNTYNVASLYQVLGVSTVRALDSGFDVCAVYNDDLITNVSTGATLSNCTNAQGTHVNWIANSSGANVNNTSSYTFTTVDFNLEAIYNSGAELYLRLGENNNGPNDTTDFTNWATVAKNLYRHVSGVNSGFGSAPTHTLAPAYIEVFNEPDGGFWLGTKANFYSLYNATYDSINAIAPSNIKIGGAGFTTTFETHIGMTSNVASTFVSNVTTSRLDFLSSHVYGSCDTATLSEMTSNLSYLRSFMNANGLSAKPLIISEWNIGLDCSSETSFHSARAQSFNSAMMSLMQDTNLNIEKSMIYNGFGQMSFLSVDPSNVGTVSVHPGAWAFKAHSQLAGGTLLNLNICDSTNTCLSGVNTVSSPLQATAVSLSSQVRAVIANDSSSSASTTIEIDHWAGSSTPTVTITSYPTTSTTVSATLSSGVYTVSGTNASNLLTSSVQTTSQAAQVSGTTLTSTLNVPAQSTLLVTIQ